VRGVVAEVRDRSGKLIARCDEALLRRYPLKMQARWYRTGDAIRAVEPEAFLEDLVAEHHEAKTPQATSLGKVNVDVTGVVFPEELRWREFGDGWIFLVRYREKKQHGKSRGNWVPYFARPGRAGRVDLSMRIPELTPLANKVVAVVGLGGLGAPSAIDFARCGLGELRFLEFDHMEAGTAVRWPLGIPFAGIPKVELAAFIRENWPYTHVTTFQHRLGSTRQAEDKSDLEIVDGFLANVDLIYDASAELGIQYFLSELARERAVPYVAVSSTTGAWGGRLVRIVPGRSEGCWVCLMHHLVDESVPPAPADPSGEIQPTGCADPTFTGASFDLAPVVNEGVRLAVATLCRGEEDAYPDPGWEVGILSLRDDEGRVIPPSWWTSPLMRHARCRRCSAAA
jgi:molybdopterin/thiamine biosynthesis adenylyltransferase